MIEQGRLTRGGPAVFLLIRALISAHPSGQVTAGQVAFPADRTTTSTGCSIGFAYQPRQPHFGTVNDNNNQHDPNEHGIPSRP